MTLANYLWIAISLLVLAPIDSSAFQTQGWEVPDSGTETGFDKSVQSARRDYTDRLQKIARQIVFLETSIASAAHKEELLVIRIGLDAERHDAGVAYESAVIGAIAAELTRIQEAVDKLSRTFDLESLARQRELLLVDISKLRSDAEEAFRMDMPEQAADFQRVAQHLVDELQQLDQNAAIAPDLSVALEHKIRDFARRKEQRDIQRKLHRARRNAKAIEVLQREHRRVLEDLIHQLDRHLSSVFAFSEKTETDY